MVLTTLIANLFRVYETLIVVWCVLTWIPRGASVVDAVRDALGQLVCPYLDLFRKLIPPFGGVDFSPIVALLVLELIENLMVRVL